jgi:hypothetical protein
LFNSVTVRPSKDYPLVAYNLHVRFGERSNIIYGLSATELRSDGRGEFSDHIVKKIIKMAKEEENG